MEKDKKKLEEKYIPVVVRFKEGGEIIPLIIEFEDGKWFRVEKVLDERKAACNYTGGVGVRYTYRILGQNRGLWLEKGRWFVEIPIPQWQAYC